MSREGRSWRKERRHAVKKGVFGWEKINLNNQDYFELYNYLVSAMKALSVKQAEKWL